MCLILRRVQADKLIKFPVSFWIDKILGFEIKTKTPSDVKRCPVEKNGYILL